MPSLYSDRFLADKAIDVIDEAGSRVRFGYALSLQVPEEARELQNELRHLTEEKKEAIDSQEFEKASKLRDRDIDLKTQLSAVIEKNMEMSEAKAEVADGDTLHKRIVGQDEAVVTICRAVCRAHVGLKDPNGPITSFIFSGPIGVGKSELTNALAACYFGSEEAMIRLDMSEFMERHTVSKLIGSPPGYVGYSEGGQLTEAIRRRAHTVVLFHEIEMAHPDVFNLMLQILAGG
ncbi:hypothetical protein Droror1_Dr00008196 [Drosera rotundifolia]